MNENNLICSAFAFKEGFDTSRQLGLKAGSLATLTYLKSILVTLASAKHHNQDCDVVLFTNTELPPAWDNAFRDAGVSTRVCPFDSYTLPKDYNWALAFYKLCVLSHAVNDNEVTGKYSHILLMDADTYSTRSYHELWQEADFGVLMYEVGHSFNHPDREVIRKDYDKFFGDKAEPVIHYGGELVAGRQDHLKRFISKCDEVFKIMTADPDRSMSLGAGDETIWSVAASLADVPVIHAGAYIFRFWTQKFYLVSTVAYANPVCIWHLPAEKEDGFLRMYEYYSRHGQFPTDRKAGALFGIPGPKRSACLSHFLFKVKKKLWKTFAR